MQTDAAIASQTEQPQGVRAAAARLLAYLPQGNTLDDASWGRRHRLLTWVLLLHVPGMLLLGLGLGDPLPTIGYTLIGPVAGVVAGHLVRQRRLASFFVTGGLVFCSAGLVVLCSGSIEAHFHFFIIIGFIALYQDWVPFLWNVTFTVLSHGIGTIWLGGAIFAHSAGQANPWLWSFIHGIAVLAACAGMVIFWRITEDEQTAKEALGRRLVTADAEIGRRRFTSEMLVNLARRNQSMLHRQMDIINQMEEKEQDPDALSDLFTLDHLATRVRRNAESLLVLAGEKQPRTWAAPVLLCDVVRAAIAETEDLDRVVFAVDGDIAVVGNSVADLTHLLAELTENAVHFSPPDTSVTIRARPDRRVEGGHLLTVEDWGVGMPPDDLAAANDLLGHPREVDLAVAQRLGFHVVARLAARHGIAVSLSVTPGSGVTAIVNLPPALFGPSGAESLEPAGPPVEARPYVTGRPGRRDPSVRPPAGGRHGWVEPVPAGGALPRVGAVATRPRLRPAQVPISNVPDVWAPPPSPPVAEDRPRWDDPDWRGWWDPEAQEAVPTPAAVQPPPVAGNAAQGPGHTLPARPALPLPRPAPEGSALPAPAPGRRDLGRRVPQAHLAPELRRPAREDDVAPAALRGGDAAAALSRYQASRQAAQALVESPDTAGTQQ